MSLKFNPYDWDFHDDPFPVYRRLRDEAPVYQNSDMGFYALSRYDDVLTALHDPTSYCSSEGITLEPKSPLPMIITLDPPDHTKMRRLVSRAFTPKRIAEQEESVRDLTRRYLDEFTETGSCDFVHDFSARLPMDLISRMMGVPAADQDLLRGYTDLMIARDEGLPDVPPAGIEAGAKVFRYFLDLVRELRLSPGDDLTSTLLQVEVDGEQLSDIDVVAFCVLLIIAGNETTTKLLANTLFWLWTFPDQRTLIANDPGLIDDCIEESLRYEGSTQLMARTTTTDVNLHDQVIPGGEKVLLLLGSGNRDERAFDDPDRFDLKRDRSRQHLSFGHGIHVCLGAALARLEMRVALEEIHARIPDYEIDQTGCVRVHAGNVRGYSRMPMTFTPAGSLSGTSSGIR